MADLNAKNHSSLEIETSHEAIETEGDILVDVETGGMAAFDDDDENENHFALTTPTTSDEESTTPRADNNNNNTRPSLTRGLHGEESRWGVSQARLLRKSTAMNLSTGVDGGKETSVQQVTSHCNAMNPNERLYNQFFGIEEQGRATAVPIKQYRLSARSSKRKRSWVELITGTRAECDEYDVTLAAKADLLTSYLRWTFRTTFSLLLLFSCACYLVISCAFAICIHIVGLYQPACISVGGLNYTAAEEKFIDAFALSWTTLSTVGYGHIYPNLAIDGGPRCLAINFFCTLEAFVGVLFAGCMGAIIFGKVARVQSFAPTTFSDPIVVRYGTGLLPEQAQDDLTEASSVKSVDSHDQDQQQIPCPILEFRVVNRMHSTGGGEIINCKLNVVASVLESEASEALKELVLHKSHQEKKQLGKTGAVVTDTTKHVGKVAAGKAKQVGNVAGMVTSTAGRVTGTSKIIQQVGNIAGSLRSSVGSRAVRISSIISRPSLEGIEEDKSFTGSEGSSVVKSVYAASMAKQTASLVDEGSDLAPRRIFSSLNVETPKHPFFKRVWYVRHVLDENSPLLSTEAKRMISENNGFWPEQLNNYQSVRENLHFHEIIVNLSGTSNATGSTVYCQKVYSFVDVNIGYTFAKVLLRRDDGLLGVDVSLLNDVLEQNGGGGEPFTTVVDGNFLGDAVGAAEKVAKNVADRTQGQLVGATQNVVDLTKEKVVHFKGTATDSRHDVVAGDEEEEQSGMKKEV